MSPRDGAALSVVVVTRDRFAPLRRTVAHLQRQTIADRIELLIVAPSAEAIEARAEELEGFHAVRVLPAGPIGSRGRAAALGVRAAGADLVALVENHSFPDPGWAQALLAAHAGPWAVVGPAVTNANPGSLVSWASFFVTYGALAAPTAPGPREYLAFHNSAFKRAALAPYADRLDDLLDREGALHEALGGRRALYLEPAATTAHGNPTGLGEAVALLFQYGRTFGHRRSASWSAARRTGYALAAPLIPWPNLARVLGDVRRVPEGRARTGRLLPLLVLLVAASAAGEAVGYLAGSGEAHAWLDEHEFHSLDERSRRGAAPARP